MGTGAFVLSPHLTVGLAKEVFHHVKILLVVLYKTNLPITPDAT